MQRLATIEDVPVIAELHAASWRQSYHGALSDEYLAGDVVADRRLVWSKRLQGDNDRQHVIVVYIDQELAGFACTYAEVDPIWGALLDNLHVARQFQHRGIGRLLLQDSREWTISMEPTGALHLWVLQSNWNAQAFYESLGGRIVGTDSWTPPGGGPDVPRYRMAWRPV